jgi:rhodanese-related sulfurtransferase
MTQPQPISAQELHQRLQAEQPPLLVDVRESMELELAALPQVVHLPLSLSEQWLERLPQLLDRNRDLAVFCHVGIRSWQFGCWLILVQGYERVWNLEGGIDAWSLQVDPAVPRY